MTRTRVASRSESQLFFVKFLVCSPAVLSSFVSAACKRRIQTYYLLLRRAAAKFGAHDPHCHTDFTYPCVDISKNYHFALL